MQYMHTVSNHSKHECILAWITHTTEHTFSLLTAQVDMSNEEDSFQGVASQCMNALVLGLNTRLDASLQVRKEWLLCSSSVQMCVCFTRTYVSCD